jgi:hypothetical protein
VAVLFELILAHLRQIMPSAAKLILSKNFLLLFHPQPHMVNSMNVPDLGFFSKELAVAIGLYESIIFNKLQWCVESPQMSGTLKDGQKWIRNPIACTDPEKREQAQEHGKAIDWLSNFPFLSAYQIRGVFARLEQLGLVVSRQFRAGKWDHCKYYTIDNEKLAELLKALKISICQFSTNRSVESQHIDLSSVRKSYQYSISEKLYQRETPTEEAGATILINLEKENQEEDQVESNSKPVKKVDSATEPITSRVEKCSAPSSSVERQLFFERLLAYCYQRVDIDSPEGYANWVMKESKSRVPEASVAMLWDEFNAGEELGSRLVPPGFRLRGVPEQVVAEAIAQDCISKVGTTATEAAKSAAGQLRRLPVVAAVANAVKLQLERCIESATRQVELGVPKEQAILNNLPTYAMNCTEDSTPQIAATESTALDSTDPYTLTDENKAARAKACETIKAIKAIAVNIPKRETKRQQILAANMAELTPFVKPVTVQVEAPATVNDEPILW